MRIQLHQKEVKAKAAHHPAERPEMGVHRSESTGQAHASCQGWLVIEALSYSASHLF